MKIRATDNLLWAKDTRHLKPAEPVYMVNLELYREVLRNRVTLGVVQMQNMRFLQMVRFAQNPKNKTVSAS